MNKSFEIKGYINNVLKEIGLEGADTFDKALFLNALGKLEAAEHSDEYKDVITEELDKVIKDNNISIGQNDLVNFMYGNVCYSVGKNDIAVNIAKQTETQPRTESGYFTGAEGGKCLCVAFKALSFYMNYETKDGGKEHYNDIIAQYNALYADCFEDVSKAAHDGDAKAVRALALFAAGAVDTLEVMDQALYEIFARIREIYKAAVAALNETIDSTDSEAVKLIYAYAVLKGCRMKLIQTEKYAAKAEEIFGKATDKHVADKNSLADTAAYITAYSEYMRNRDYQDYGRSNGGVLWS
ncbi:MAG: hypothetical protein Q4E78_00290 [Eubacteriales bacterium]|nr:hypothetical protein [Eubacteriales bacterium]